jgi:hypothetical protein
MEMNILLRNILEIGFGILFTIGAIFNSLYTFRNGEEFYGSFAEKGLFPPARLLVQKVVIPRNQFFTFLMIAFQLIVAICILSRGLFVRPGLFAGAVFAFGAAWVSNAGGMIANLLMAIVLFLLGVSY